MQTYSPLKVKDQTLNISLNFDKAPPGLMFRELVRNAYEALPAPGEVKRIIRIYKDHDGKAVIINSGLGLDESQLRDITDLQSSLFKETGTDGRLNRGEGAKMACMRFNPAGMRIRCRKDGVIREVLVYKHADAGYVREMFQIEDDQFGNPQYNDVVELDIDDTEEVTAEERERYEALTTDFFEVRLNGLAEDHETAFDPYGTHYINSGGGYGVKLTIAHELFERFYELPEANGGLPSILQMSYRFREGGKDSQGQAKQGFRQFVSLGELINNKPDLFENFDNSLVIAKVGDHEIKIRYLMTTSDEKSRSVFNQFSLGENGARAAIVWRGEMYDVQAPSKWKQTAGYFGMDGVANDVSVLVEMPDDYGNLADDRFREKLQLSDGTEFHLRNSFLAGLIVNNRPQWLLDLRESRRNGPTQSRNVRDRLKAFATKLKATAARLQDGETGLKLKVITGGLVEGGGKVPVPRTTSPSNDDTAESTNKRKAATPSSEDGTGHGTGTGGHKRRGKKTNKGEVDAIADENSKKNATTVPNYRWITEAELGDHGDLSAWGAVYNAPTQEYLLNEAYPAFENIVHQEKERVDKNIREHDGIDALVRCVVRDHIAEKVGYAVLITLNKKGKFDARGIEAMLDYPAMTVVFDSCFLDSWSIHNKLTNMSEYKTIKSSVTPATPLSLVG